MWHGICDPSDFKYVQYFNALKSHHLTHSTGHVPGDMPLWLGCRTFRQNLSWDSSNMPGLPDSVGQCQRPGHCTIFWHILTPDLLKPL